MLQCRQRTEAPVIYCWQLLLRGKPLRLQRLHEFRWTRSGWTGRFMWLPS